MNERCLSYFFSMVFFSSTPSSNALYRGNFNHSMNTSLKDILDFTGNPKVIEDSYRET